MQSIPMIIDMMMFFILRLILFYLLFFYQPSMLYFFLAKKSLQVKLVRIKNRKYSIKTKELPKRKYLYS